ncbi:MAG: uridine phosphorylase [Candidatus Bipolaricaulota bacterium]|nr:uridine phosphorylase [Candidatus Bipolaricaulota bacterium]MCS7274926.1 uridine phosphorylase [Candidatus Bipolaricaulota bacterium]MDW8110293.1 uridine phosphorylase [Candidatus Bipolaricaulota bacterium]MDW8328811.1 uridine phosphorylase [Candidatus Bipolaricaulota bacterium]
MRHVYHLDLTEEQIQGARIALLPGDPARVEKIAQRFSKSQPLAFHREFKTSLAYVGETPVLVTSTGIGGPSTSIAIEELALLGVRTFIRVGTCGALQPTIKIGDVVITTGAVRREGASLDYAPLEYPAVAHYQIVHALQQAAQELQIPHHVGITCSTATFYPGQERTDSFSQYTLLRLRGMTEEWQRLNVLNYEMEAATLLTICSALGMRGGCVSGVVDRHGGTEIRPEDLRAGEQNAIQVSVRAVELLLTTEFSKIFV